MAVNEAQQKFLEHLARRIPHLFDAIRAGNIKSEYIIGVRQIGFRHVRLKLVAEVVDPGENPLKTHGMLVPSSDPVEFGPSSEIDLGSGSATPPRVSDKPDHI